MNFTFTSLLLLHWFITNNNLFKTGYQNKQHKCIVIAKTVQIPGNLKFFLCPATPVLISRVEHQILFFKAL